MGAAGIFRLGIPTEPDVDLLLNQWPPKKMDPGDNWSYEDVAKVIGVEVDSNRFESVTTAWRKKLETMDIFIDRPRNGTFRVTDDSQKLETSRRKLRTSARAARRSHLLHKMVDPKKLDESQQKTYELMERKNAAVMQVFQIRKSSQDLPTLLE